MKVCDICDKGKTHGNNVPHSKHKTKRSWLPNLHTIKTANVKTGEIEKKQVCTRCIRTLAKKGQ